jgi:hypothetical protein
MRVGWLVGCVLGVAGAAQAQQTVTTVTIERAGEKVVAPSSKMSGHAGSALASGGSAEAAMLAEQALDKDGFNPWAHYRRAAALSDQRRTDEAVAEYKIAEQAFTGVDDRGKSLALYGRAFTLAEAGRCADARPVYEEYARFVEKRDAKGAAQARSNAQSCQSTASAPEQTARTEPPRQSP